MFDSGITAKTFVSDLKNEVDIALPIPDKTYLDWLNALEQLVYTEIIKEQNAITIAQEDMTNPLDISTLNDDTENAIRFEDIYAVYADETQLIKSTLTSGGIFSDTYFKEGNKLGYNVLFSPYELKIIYLAKPILKTMTGGNPDAITDNTNVMLPIEFIDIAKSKLRGEAYKLANEDNLAAKWLNDYNVLLENFKAWVADKSASFGL